MAAQMGLDQMAVGQIAMGQMELSPMAMARNMTIDRGRMADLAAPVTCRRSDLAL
jgi:hypothetical protein